MNKFLKKLTILVICLFTFTLSACNEKVDNAPRVEITKSYALRTTVDVEFTIWDIDENLVSLSCEIVTVDFKSTSEDYYTSKKTITMYGGGFETNDEGEELEDGDFIGEEKTTTFTGLETNVKYKVTFTGTYGNKAYILASTTLTTDEVGGTDENPHLIYTLDDLKTVGNDKDGYFKLENDIDCGGEVLSPFFTSSKQFIGTFDGQGNTIHNYVQSNFDQNVGLFGYIGAAGSVCNLNIEDVSIDANRTSSYVRVGGFAGTNYGTISNVSMKNVTMSTLAKKIPQYVGGFVGVNIGEFAVIEDCTIEDVHINLNSPRTVVAGGFVGWNQQDGVYSTITNSNAINVLIDVMITSNPDFDTDEDEKQEFNVQVGGYVGNNGGLIEDSYAISKILVYVEGTTTDFEVNGYPDSEDLDPEATETTTETQRHVKVKSIVADIGGFAGNNSGQISNSGVNVSIDFENAYITQLNAGGFVGANSGKILESIFKAGDFNFTFNDNTKITSTVDEVEFSLIGLLCGFNNGSASNLDVYYQDNFNYYLNTRTDVKVDDVVNYSFDELVINFPLEPNYGPLNSKYSSLYSLISGSYQNNM